MTHTAQEIVHVLGLVPHPEGGYYRETYRSDICFDASTVSDRFPGIRCCSTTIYFLLEDHDFSAFHRIKADEIWHFYTGSPLTVHVITPDGIYQPIYLGSDMSQGQVFQATVTAGSWFAASVTTKTDTGYALVGCSTAPGFEFEDFEMTDRDDLIGTYPHLSEIISIYTR